MSAAGGAPNVGSARGDVERGRRLRAWLAIALLVGSTVASGCVETAECNATVRCPGEQICYDFECRLVCEAEADCEHDERCAACIPDDASDDQGHCFGVEERACVPEEEL